MKVLLGVVVAITALVGGAYVVDEITYRPPYEVFDLTPGRSYIEWSPGDFVPVPTDWEPGDLIPLTTGDASSLAEYAAIKARRGF